MSDDGDGSTGPRRRARERCMQALYHWQLNPVPVAESIDQYATSRTSPAGAECSDIDFDYAARLLAGIVESEATLTAALARFVDRPLEQLNPLERAVMLIGLFELSEQASVPWRVVINEAVDLAQLYGAEGGYRYVNAVLDKAAQEFRSTGDTT